MGVNGAIAQLGERCNRTAEVVSSNLIGSTKIPREFKDLTSHLFVQQEPSYHIATTHVAGSVPSALDLWLSGFASENTRRAYRKEIAALAAFACRQNVAEAVAHFLNLEDAQAHAVAEAWRARKLKDGHSPAASTEACQRLTALYQAPGVMGSQSSALRPRA